MYGKKRRTIKTLNGKPCSIWIFSAWLLLFLLSESALQEDSPFGKKKYIFIPFIYIYKHNILLRHLIALQLSHKNIKHVGWVFYCILSVGLIWAAFYGNDRVWATFYETQESFACFLDEMTCWCASVPKSRLWGNFTRCFSLNFSIKTLFLSIKYDKIRFINPFYL